MSELLLCPFCGGEDLEIDHAPTYDVHHPDVYEVHCVECGGRGGEGWTEAEAIEAWNSRAERTCKPLGTIRYDYEGGYAGFEYETELSCGHKWRDAYGDFPYYCPNCGAKVKDVDE